MALLYINCFKPLFESKGDSWDPGILVLEVALLYIHFFHNLIKN